MSLKDIREKKTPITIGDKTYNLHYDMNAFAELEEIYGSVKAAMDKLAAGKISVVRDVLWVGLIHENEELTRKEVGKLFDLSEIEELSEIINEAVVKAVPEVKEEAKNKKSKNVQTPTRPK